MGSPAELIGRDRHVRELELLLDGVAGGRGGALVLSGEAGAGKTRLAEEAAELAHGHGLAVAWATCWFGASAPLSAWFDLVTSLDPDVPVGTSDPTIAEVDPDAARALLFRRLVADLRQSTATRPTLLVVDDMQWCDPLSRRALTSLMGSVRTCPIGIVMTFRDDGDAVAARYLAELSRVGRHLVVPPLTPDELAALAVAMTGRTLAPSTIERLWDRTAGNVLFAREMLVEQPRSLGDAAVSSSTAARAGLFAERIADLPPETIEMVHAASVVGRRFRLDLLAEIHGVDTSAVIEVLEPARGAGLLRDAGAGACEFVHPLMAESAYAAVTIPSTVRLHRDVGAALERMRDRGLEISAAELAHHYSHAAAEAPAEALRFAAEAGAASMRQLAYEDAARDFERALCALDLCPADDAQRVELMLDLADALAAAGDVPAARSTYTGAARLARARDWPDRLARAALGLGAGPGGFEVPPFDGEQIALLEEAAVRSTGGLRAKVLAHLSVALSLAPDEERRRDLSTEAVGVARDDGDPLALGQALASWCDVIPGPDDVETRLEATSEILACAAAANDTPLELLGRRLRVVALLEAGAAAEVDGEIDAFESCANRVGQPGYSWYVPLWRAMRAAAQGRLAASENLRSAAVRVGQLAHSENAAMLSDSQRAMLLCELRDPAEATRFFEDITARWPGYTEMARPALPYAHAASGDTVRAEHLLSDVRIGNYTVAAFGSEVLPMLSMLAFAVWLADVDVLAAELYSALLPHRGRHAIDGIGAYDMGIVERPLGLLAARRGDAALAAAHLDAALAHHRAIGAELLLAGTLRDAGEALGDPSMLDEARARFGALGAPGGMGVRARTEDSTRSPDVQVFHRDGDGWVVGRAGATVRLRHSKGMADIARLLARPGTEMHVLDLVADGPTLNEDSLEAPIDPLAERRYRARLVEIDEELAEADARADAARSERLAVERDALIAELSAAYGLGGRRRRRSDSAERARSAVTQRIRDAIARIAAADGTIGNHLRRSVKTGTFCSYDPEQPTHWQL